MNRLSRWGVLCLAGAGLATTPSLTIHSGGASATYTLSRVASLSFGDSTTGLQAAAVTRSVGFTLRRSGGAVVFSLRGEAGTQASLQLVDVRGRVAWTGSTRLDASGTGTLTSRGLKAHGLLIARYANGSFAQTRVLPMVGGAR